jgi:Pyruvate/2-oxoacid:ferredoxin oxidoreductase gamma subunit
MASRKKPIEYKEGYTPEIVNFEEQEFFQDLVDSVVEETFKIDSNAEEEETEEEISLTAEQPVVEEKIIKSAPVPPTRFIQHQRNIPKFSRTRNKTP